MTDTDHGNELGADVAVLGECEEILPRLVPARPDWADVPSVAYVGETGTSRAQTSLHASVMLQFRSWLDNAVQRCGNWV